MQIGSFRFAPPWWGIVIALVTCAILASLGAWQIQRAHYKQRLVEAHQQATAAGPQTLDVTPSELRDAPATAGPPHGYRTIATGHYAPARQILLANQVRGTQTGYRIWTPFILESGAQIMVDRGWMPKDQSPGAPLPDPAAPSGATSIHGFWRNFPQPGLRFGDNKRCDLTAWPRSMNYPSAASVRCQYATPLANGLLLLDADQAGGFVRDWDEDTIGLRPWGHYAYASQWFLMALVALIILIVVNTKRIR